MKKIGILVLALLFALPSAFAISLPPMIGMEAVSYTHLLEGDLIYPKVVGSSIGLPGVLVISAVLIGQGLMGVFGILLFVPLTAVLYTCLLYTSRCV